MRQRFFAFLLIFMSFAVLSISPIAQAAKSKGCTLTTTGDSWSPVPKVTVTITAGECGPFNTTQGTFATNSVTATTNSAKVVVLRVDYYFEGVPHCAETTPATCSFVSYFEETDTTKNIFPHDTETFGPFTGAMTPQCIVTGFLNFTVRYTPTGVTHTLSTGVDNGLCFR